MTLPEPQKPDKLTEARQLAAKALSLLSEIEETPTKDDPWLCLKDLEAMGWTRESLRSAVEKGLKVFRGPRQKIMVRRSEVDRFIESRPWKPGARKAKPADTMNEAHEAAAAALGVAR